MKQKPAFAFAAILLVPLLYMILPGLSLAGAVSSETPVFPIPQEMELTGDDFAMDESVSILIPEENSENDVFLARFLVRELSDRYGIALRIETAGSIPGTGKVVVMGSSDNPLVQRYCGDHHLQLAAERPGPEGYLMQVSGRLIVIAGWDDAGAFYGLQSLRQLLDVENGRKVPGIRITDRPRLPFRGIRLYVPGPENIAFFKRFLRDFMALYKFNRVIIEVNCMRLDHHPEVNAGWIEFAEDLQYSRLNRTEGPRGELKNSSHFDAGDGRIIEKNDLRDIVDLANRNFIEVIPEIPSLTHGYYLLTRHPELAEYPGDPWPDTYCPSNPASYDLMFDVYDEYIEVMHPKMVHIGHDEWRMPLGVCPRCRGKDYSTLFAQDVNRIHDYMSKRGIKIAMWGDHLLQSVRNAGPREGVSSTGVKYMKPGGLRPSVVRDSIPKDILVFNWFWVDPERDRELYEFGFRQLYGNFKPNISNWDERISKINLAGGAPSSWAATDEFNFGKDLMVDFLGCANLLWSPHTLAQEDLIGVVREQMPFIRSSLSMERIPSEEGNRVETLDISSYFNLAQDPGLFGINLASLESREVRSRSGVFRLAGPAPGTGNCAVAVGSAGTGAIPLPTEISGIEVNEDVSSLVFLHACALPADNQKAYYNIPDFFDTPDLLGWYEVVYEDGYKEIVPVQYGVNILEWNPGGEHGLDRREGRTGSPQNAYCYRADPVPCAAGPDRQLVFYAYEWVNPRFGKKISHVNLHGSVRYRSTLPSSNPETRPMGDNAILLVALSKVAKREPLTIK